MGEADAASVIFLVFLIGGAFTVVDETGALRQSIGWLVRKLGDREILIIPIVAAVFATGGVLENMQEEIIPLIPVLLIVTRRIGFDALTAVSMSAGAAFVGSAFSPINPFQAGIAQKLAQLPLLSGGGYRMIFLAIALTIWIGGTMRHAMRTRVAPDDAAFDANETVSPRSGVIVGMVLVTFGLLTFGILRLGWDFDQMSAMAAFQLHTATGKLNALMTPTTPSGCHCSNMRWSGRSDAMVRP